MASWYEMLNQDGEVIAFFHGQPNPGAQARAENVWYPDGSQPSPGERMPGDIARCIHSKSIRPCSRPDFIDAAEQS